MESLSTLEKLLCRRNSRTQQERKRQPWKSSLQFTITCIATTVGLKNIWRFPYVALNNGGGIFLVCYVIVALLVGIPLYYLEIALGQFTSLPNIEIFKALSPGFAGIGCCQAMASFIISTYYGIFNSYILFYSSRSLHPPWAECKKEWGDTCITLSNIGNISHANNYTFSEELYFKNDILRLKSNSIGIDGPALPLVVASLSTWTISFLILSHGIKWLGDLSYLLALFPYFGLSALMGRTIRFDGAYAGIKHLIKPNWPLLFEPKIWFEATIQCLLSLGQGFGTITALSSYNKFNYDSKTIAAMVVLLDTITSLCFGVATFSVLGNLSTKLNVTIDQIPNKGPELVFVSYAQALSALNGVSRIFLFFVYFTLFTISIGSVLGQQLVTIDTLQYVLPFLKYWHIALIASGFSFAASIAYLSPAGNYLRTLICIYYEPLVFIVLITVILMIVIYVYGLQNICWDIEYMSQSHLEVFWRISWAVIDVVLLTTVVVYTFITTEPLKTQTFTCPRGFKASVRLFLFTVLLPLPLTMMLEIIINSKQGCTECVKKTFTNEDWRPLDEEHYEEWKILKSAAKMKIQESRDSRLVKFLKSLFRMYN